MRHNGRIATVAEQRIAGEGREIPRQFLLHPHQREFVLFDQSQVRCAITGALTAQLGADGAAGTGHHDTATAEPSADGLPIWRHRVTAQQVFDGDFLQLAGP